MRVRLFSLGFVLLFVVIAGRAYQLQVHDRARLLQRVEQQQQRVIPLTPQRGTIYDGNGKEMAISLEVDSIYAHPAQVADPQAATKLAKALGTSVASVKRKLGSGKNFVWIERLVSPQESAKVKALGLAGVQTTREHKRYYPNSHIGAQVLGFTGVDPKGLEGLELYYDSHVLGEGGYLFTQRDALGQGMAGVDDRVRTGSRGQDLHLTIDRNLQYIAEKELQKAVSSSHARAGHVVMLEADTGRVLAMASQPDFNPNAISKYKPFQWRNRALTDAYEPGSTLKVFLLAAALQERVVGAQQKIDCEHGSYTVGGKTIHDHKPYGKLTVGDILKHSSNIGAAKIGKALERGRLHDYLRDFGFGSRTGIDLPGEVSGLLRQAKDWFEVDLAAISFGQGLSVTTLQMATATAAIANGGTLMRPYLVDRIVDADGQVVRQTRPQVVRRVVDEQVAATLRAMMAHVVTPDGTGRLAAVSGFRVAGKTGTAQKVDPVTGGYSVDKRVVSFIGFAPLEQPKLVIAVAIDEPEENAWGGVLAAPVFAGIASQGLQYLQVAPTLKVEGPTLPPVQPAALAAVPVQAVRTAGNDSAQLMPDFRGMSLRQALQTMQRTGLNIKLKGSGRAVEQFPAPQQPVRFGSEIWVRFVPPVQG